MFARRHFLRKRSQNGAHVGLAVRDNSSLVQLNTPSALPSTSPGAKTTEAQTSPTSAAPAPETSLQTISFPSFSFPSLPIPITFSSSSTTPTSTSKSLASASSSLTSPASSINSTPTTLNTPTTYAPSVTTRIVAGTSFTPASSLSPTPTSSTSSSTGSNTGAIVGGIAGALAGIAALSFLLMWCMRRQRDRDSDDFDAQAFKRQSAVLLDDPVEPPRSYNPRPLTMVEHHNVSPALAAQAEGGGQNFYGNYGGYDQQSPYASPEMAQPAVSAPSQAYGTPSMGYAGYNDPRQQIVRQPSNVGYGGYGPQQQLARQPSSAAYLTRQPSSAAGYRPLAVPPSSLDPNAHYIDLNRSSVSPYQAAQYADISRQLRATNPNAQGHHELPQDPLPSPFDDPAEAAPAAAVTSAHAHPTNEIAPSSVTATRPPHTQGNTAGADQRPVTVYQEGDAYGGI